jgi:hypothetical protein
MRLAVTLILTPLVAQAEDCAVLWDQVRGLGLGYDIAGDLRAVEGGCTLTDLRLQAQSDYGVDIWVDQVTLMVADLPALARGDPFGLDLQLTATGIRTVPVIPDPVMEYLYQVQARGFAGYALSVDLGHDAATGRLDLREARVDLGPLGHLSLTFAATGITPGALLAPESLGVEGLLFETTMTGYFETFLLIPLATGFLTGPDPAAEVKALREEVLALIPQAGLDAGSTAAVTALVTDLPNPRGLLVAELGPMPAIVPALEAFMDRDDAGPLLDLLDLRLSWTRLDP